MVVLGEQPTAITVSVFPSKSTEDDCVTCTRSIGAGDDKLVAEMKHVLTAFRSPDPRRHLKALCWLRENEFDAGKTELALVGSGYPPAIIGLLAAVRELSVRMNPRDRLKVRNAVHPASDEEPINALHLLFGQYGLEATYRPLPISSFSRASLRVDKYGTGSAVLRNQLAGEVIVSVRPPPLYSGRFRSEDQHLAKDYFRSLLQALSRGGGERWLMNLPVGCRIEQIKNMFSVISAESCLAMGFLGKAIAKLRQHKRNFDPQLTIVDSEEDPMVFMGAHCQPGLWIEAGFGKKGLSRLSVRLAPPAALPSSSDSPAEEQEATDQTTDIIWDRKIPEPQAYPTPGRLSDLARIFLGEHRTLEMLRSFLDRVRKDTGQGGGTASSDGTAIGHGQASRVCSEHRYEQRRV
jgi:hypothetical protein